LEQEFRQVDRRLKKLAREQGQLLQWGLKGFPEDTILNENERINKHRAQLKTCLAELEDKINQVKQSDGDMEDIERFCQLVSENLKGLTFEEKRLALEALKIEVSVDGDNINLAGAIPLIKDDIISTIPE